MTNYRQQIINTLKDLELSTGDISVIMSFVDKIAYNEYVAGYEACEADMESK